MTYRTMTARFRGACRGCSAPVRPGQVIVTGGKGRTYHQDCKGQTEITTIYFPSSGQTIYRNVRGTCEDAPCCGCCTF